MNPRVIYTGLAVLGLVLLERVARAEPEAPLDLGWDFTRYKCSGILEVTAGPVGGKLETDPVNDWSCWDRQEQRYVHNDLCGGCGGGA